MERRCHAPRGNRQERYLLKKHLPSAVLPARAEPRTVFRLKRMRIPARTHPEDPRQS